LRSELFEYKNINVLSTYPGYINTNVSMNALRDDGSKNSINDEDHTEGYSPNYVAQVIIKGIYERKKELFISVLLHRAAVWLRFFSPALYHYLMFKRAQSKSKSKYV
jgi:short-subunit dehydrogenase